MAKFILTKCGFLGDEEMSIPVDSLLGTYGTRRKAILAMKENIMRQEECASGTTVRVNRNLYQFSSKTPECEIFLEWNVEKMKRQRRKAS